MKKIIFGLALVLSFGLLASCSQTYNVNDTESTYCDYACDVAGTVTTTNTYTRKVGDKSVTDTTVITYTLTGLPSKAGVRYTERENSNRVAYELYGSRVVGLKFSWTDGTDSVNAESVADRKYKVTTKFSGVTTTDEYTDVEVESMFGGRFPAEKKVAEDYFTINVVTYGEDDAAYVVSYWADNDGTQKDLPVSFVEEDGAYTLSGDVVTYTNKTETSSTEEKTSYNVVYTVK